MCGVLLILFFVCAIALPCVSVPLLCDRVLWCSVLFPFMCDSLCLSVEKLPERLFVLV